MKSCRLTLGSLFALLLLSMPRAEAAVRYRSTEVDGVTIFYREAGDPAAPALLLLHGFPSSSFMFRDLIPLLAGHYHVIAPDYPGFGQSGFPTPAMRPYTFAQIATLMSDFSQKLQLARYSIYVQDYGAPIGFRLALAAPERISAIIVQNGNAYAEGLSEDWHDLQAYWAAPTATAREKFRADFAPAAIKEEYLAGLPEELKPRMSPDTWTLDSERLARPGAVDLQLDLYADYGTNVALYPKIQAYLRTRRPPMLIVWGRYDTFFTLAGAKAYLRDVPAAELHLLDAGHFALETHAREIADLIQRFLAKHRTGIATAEDRQRWVPNALAIKASDSGPSHSRAP